MRIKGIDYLAMLLLLLSPILGIYGNPDGWSYETLLVLPSSALFFIYYFMQRNSITGIYNPLPKHLAGYFFYWGFLMFILSVSIPMTVIQAYLAFFLFFATFRLKKFIVFYKLFGIVCISFFFVQYVSYHITGERMSGIISSLPLYIPMDITSRVGSMRSCSFFSEPAHFAQFLIPLLAIELYYDKSKYNYFYAAVIGVVLVYLQSGNGYMGLAVILLFLYSRIKEIVRSKFKRIMIWAFVALFIAAMGYYMINGEIGEYILSRQSELSITYDGQSSRSGFLRLWRGFYVYNDYNIFEKIFGCPNTKMQIAHVSASGMAMVENAELYFNAFQKVLLNTGVVGVLLFLNIIVKIWRGNNTCGKAILGSFVAISFVSAIYMSHAMILFLLLAYSFKKFNCQIEKNK